MITYWSNEQIQHASWINVCSLTIDTRRHLKNDEDENVVLFVWIDRQRLSRDNCSLFFSFSQWFDRMLFMASSTRDFFSIDFCFKCSFSSSFVIRYQIEQMFNIHRHFLFSLRFYFEKKNEKNKRKFEIILKIIYKNQIWSEDLFWQCFRINFE